jgi:thiamine biosynthesis lipoprotein ApbE
MLSLQVLSVGYFLVLWRFLMADQSNRPPTPEDILERDRHGRLTGNQ